MKSKSTINMLKKIWDTSPKDINGEVPIPSASQDTSFYNIFLEKNSSFPANYSTQQATLLMVVGGEAKIEVDGKILKMKAGTLLTLKRKIKYRILKLETTCYLVKIKFHISFKWIKFIHDLHLRSTREQKLAEIYSKRMLDKGYFYFLNSAKSLPSKLCVQLLHEYWESNLFTWNVGVYFTQLILVSSLERVRADNTELPVLNKENLIDYIDENYANINLTVAARHFGFSSSYFSRQVKKIMGTTFIRLVEKRRIEEAKRLRITKKYTINEIMQEVGYASKSFFYKKLKEEIDNIN
ncbi:helix-turn-helix domain-containing protein [Lactobacillus sp. PV037]|uniref:helix-turn-helix domain-containing protein n=1 Tax=Lactobacillus sp. PV037 TaxID=2594496 RepID=UPI00223FE12E|nr:helix-turn-helix domain-containing protein [Lactobacillus sp. PV037]QNQ84268.1 helix-turn-helix domain-containing protein [Lactobacillus sp. PV037]